MNTLAPVFWQNTLPLMVTIVVTVFGATMAGRASNKNLASRIDGLRFDLHGRIDEVNHRLERIEQKLDSHEARLTTLEERTSPLRR